MSVIHTLRRSPRRRCAWCGTQFPANGPGGGWPCCSKSCYDRLRANAAQPIDREDLFAGPESTPVDDRRGAAPPPSPQRPGD